MQVWVEKAGVVMGGFVDVPVDSTVGDCLRKANITYVPGERIELNGLDTKDGKKVDLSTVVKDRDEIMVIPNYSGGASVRLYNISPR